MSEDIIFQIVRIIEWLAVPVLYGVLLFLFFFLFVRPFFSYIFDPKRIAMKKIIDEHKTRTESATKLNELVEFEDLTIGPDEDIPDFLTDQKKIAKLATSDPEKGGNLVKQWLHSDK
jgi:flagellar biosynthesis/type III secretory pathway M-ring protein FliF/YscJ